MKKISYIILILFTLFVYRAELFNIFIKYEPLQVLEVQELTDPYWTDKVDNILVSDSYVGIVELNDILIRIIAQHLKFGRLQLTNNPNNFRELSEAHCVGYSALNASMLRYACKLLNDDL